MPGNVIKPREDSAFPQALALNDRAVDLHAKGQFGDALGLFDQALRIDAGRAEIHLNRALTLHALERFDEALAVYDHLLAQHPDLADAHNNRGNVLRALKRDREALIAYDRAIALNPDLADAHNNRGNSLRNLQRYADAISAYDRAIVFRSDFAQAHFNRGFALQELKRNDEALMSYDRAIALTPDYADAHWSKAFIHLLTGDFAKGWPLYEWRWKRKDYLAPRRHFPQAAWHGDFDIKGKTIFLYAEQGLGDTIQFCRYAKLVAARGAKVVLEVQPALQKLMTTLDGVEHLIAVGDPLPAFDCHAPLLSLPLAFQTDLTNIPANTPYLHAPNEAVAKWAGILGEKRAPRAGLAWAGSALHKNDRNRSMKLFDLLPLMTSGVEFVSLQKDMPRAERVMLAALPAIKDIGTRFENFADTAGAIHHMDLVITVDTAIAHLAGALGKPVWILLPFAPEWRWLMDCSDCPWYPHARLFRQQRCGDWMGLVDTVTKELQNRTPNMIQV